MTDPRVEAVARATLECIMEIADRIPAPNDYTPELMMLATSARAELDRIAAMHSSRPVEDGEATAWSWLESKYLNVEAGHDPNDRDYSADEMVDAFMAGATTQASELVALKGEIETLREHLQIAIDEHDAHFGKSNFVGHWTNLARATVSPEKGK